MAIKIDHQQNLIIAHDNELNFDPVIDIVNNTASTNSTTGALKVAGGVGVQGNINVGGDMNVGGTVTMSGNFQVTGTSTQLVSTTINQALIKLGEGSTLQSVDQGFVVTRGDGVSTNTNNVAAFWDESADEFVLASTPTEDGSTNGNVTIVDYSPMHLGGLIVEDNIQVNTNATISGTLAVTNTSSLGAVNASGDLKVNSTKFIVTASTGNTDIDAALTVTGVVSGGSLKAGDLTSGRVALVGTSGTLVDISDFTYNDTTGVVAYASNGAFQVPRGTTAQRPAPFAEGMLRINSDSGTLEVFDSNGWSTLLASLISDTTPQLGGNLDLNSQNINGTGNISVTGSVSASISVVSPTLENPTSADPVAITGGLTTGDAKTITANDATAGDIVIGQGKITFEGSVADANETVLTVTNPSADRTITFQDASGTVAFTSQVASTTDDLTEGSTNLYFTNARADARIAANIIDEDGFVTDSDTRAPSQQSVKAYIASQIATKDNTDEITEGSTNLYYTDARAQAVSINNVVEDTTPQLGGDLDVGGNSIVSTSSGPINIAPNGTGKISLSGVTQLGGNLEVNGQSIVSLSGGDIAITPDGAGKVIIDGLSYPTADGTTGQFLKTDGSGNLAFDTVTTDLVNDTSPELGGDLFINGKKITSQANDNIEISGGNNSDIILAPGGGTGKIVLSNLNFPTSDGSNGHVLTTNGSGQLAFASVSSLAGSGIQDVVDDTTPQLGGNLDLNDNNLTIATDGQSDIGTASNQLGTIFTNNIHMHNAYHSHASTATSSSTSQFAVDSFAKATYRSAEYFISAQDASANKFHTEKIMVMHDGTDNFMTTFATLISDNTLFTVTSDIVGANVRLLLTPTTTNSVTYRFIAEKHLI